MDDDRDLKSLYRALREEDARTSPTLQALLARPAPARRRLSAPRVLAAALVLAGVLAGAAWLAARLHAPRPALAEIWAWRSPTRALLPAGDTDGHIPRIGETWGALPPRTLEEVTR